MLARLRNAPVVFSSNLKGRVRLPVRLKGTLVEKWTNYWKNLFIDYRQMLQDLRQDMQDEPRKAMLWSAGLAAVYALARNSPNELDFRDDMKRISNEVVMVSEECRNPESLDHLLFLQMCYNEGVIHYQSLGIISFMYASELNESCDLYKAHCKYLQPTYFSLPRRVIDVGFMGRWWNIYIKTINHDVNI